MKKMMLKKFPVELMLDRDQEAQNLNKKKFSAYSLCLLVLCE